MTKLAADNPAMLAALVVIGLLAIVGVYFLVTSYGRAIAVAILALLGTAAGGDVLYHGVQYNFPRLSVIGLFLLCVFPLIFRYAMVLAKRPPVPQSPTAAGQTSPAARPAGSAPVKR
jgi:hypothetical protein